MYESGRIPREGLAGVSDRALNLADRIPMDLVLLMVRIGIGMVFLKSGLTKTTTGLDLADQTFTLFEYEYALPLIPTTVAAYLATYAEHIFPIMLFLGLGGRIAALALFGMTLVIQIFVYPDLWDIHLFWAGALLLIVAKGPGRISVDWAIARLADGR